MTNLSKNVLDRMLASFLKYIKEQNLFPRDANVLLAISGGIDSMVLLDLFRNAKLRFGIAHCNFQLRGEESDQDETFVIKKSQELGVPYFVKKFNVQKLTKEKGKSIQMIARELRYNWFGSLLKEHNYNYLATAHHKNDNIETVLFNLAKGTGLAGLRGMKPKSENIVRPILFATKEEIYQYANDNKIGWREDSSNKSNKYARNLIRHEIVPKLKEINPNLENTFEQTWHRLNSAEDFFYSQVNILKKKLLEKKEKDIWISQKKLKKIKGYESILYEVIKEYGFNYSQTQEILGSFNKQSGNLFMSDAFQLNVDREYLILSPIESQFKEIRIDDYKETVETASFLLKFEVLDINDYKLDPSKNLAFVDLEKVSLPFRLRLWQAGDKFAPLGMKNQKKLSDFMIDEKIPVNLKAKTFVLTSEGEIFWVVGKRIDDRVKITPGTTKVLKITKLRKDA